MEYVKDIVKRIKERFHERTREDIADGSMLDLYTRAIGEELQDVYQEIEDNKNPHIWTKLKGETLDDTGTWINCPRKKDESDESYRYRLMNWLLSAESSNTTAIQTALLKPTHASNIDYVPFTRGCGTGTCYITPKEYTSKNIADSLDEAYKIVEKVASAGTDIDFIVPEMRAVLLEVFMKATKGDKELIKKNIEKQIREYINKIPPGEYLRTGIMNKIGINEQGVEYFNVVSLLINGEHVSQLDVLQELKSKFIYDEISWIEDTNAYV